MRYVDKVIITVPGTWLFTRVISMLAGSAPGSDIIGGYSEELEERRNAQLPQDLSPSHSHSLSVKQNIKLLY